MTTKTIHVLTAFELNLGGGRVVKVPAGVQVVDAEVADHWYTAAHLAHGGLGTVEYAESAWGNANDAFIKAREAGENYERLLAASAEADEAAGIAPRVPPHVAYVAPILAAVDPGEPVEAVEVAAPDALPAEPAEDADGDVEEVDDATDDAEEPPVDLLDADGDGVMGGSIDKFDQMSDEALLDFLAERDGRRPHPKTSRVKLLAAARSTSPADTDAGE